MLALTLAAVVVAIISTVYAVNAWRRGSVEAQAASPLAAAEEAGWDVLERELRRARRHGRPLTLNRITVERSTPLETRAELRDRLRTTDVCFATDASVYVALPEASDLDARCAMMRLCGQFASKGLACRIETVTYPNDALTAEALVEGFRPLAVDAPNHESVDS